MKTSHTPGPWKQGILKSPIYGSDGTLVDESISVLSPSADKLVAKVGGLRVSQTEANVALICAAPDLLAALEALIPRICMHEDAFNRGEFEAARAAIRAARGQS